MENISHFIDHTILKGEATKEDIETHCKQAQELKVAAVCVLPSWLPLCKELLTSTDVKLCTVIGFPLGGDPTISKAATLDWALQQGADELDIMINLGWFKSGNLRFVEDEIKQLVTMAKGKTRKVIVESGIMSAKEIRLLTEIVIGSGAEFIKTSSGFSTRGATLDAIKTMREAVGSSGLKIKASGGIKTADQVTELLGLGVERIGTSHTNEILSGFKREK